MDVALHEYELRSRIPLNARTRSTCHRGALIRVSGGYGCLHPHPELGDVPLAAQIDSLRSGEPTPLAAQALRCAAEDARARHEGRSLFIRPVPESHWLAFAEDDPAAVCKEGFSSMKRKLGPDLMSEVKTLRLWHECGFRLRLDGNESLSLATFLEFWKALGNFRDAVELVEDPVPWHPESWRILHEAGVPVAVDREAEARHRPGDLAVLKPALSAWVPPGDAPFLVTSYMDHAIGQCWAAVEAARLRAEHGARFLGCGLLTHRCFESDPFFDRVRTAGPILMAPEGTGLGFDDLLEDLSWAPLT